MKVVKVSKIISDLKKNGWVQIHQVGSHRQFKHSLKKGKVTVNGGKNDDIWGSLLKSIESQSGIEF